MRPFLLRRLLQILLHLGDLIVVFFQIVERFTAILADRGGDHRDLAVVRRDQTADRTSFLQRRQMAILRPVSNQDIQSAKTTTSTP